MKSFLTLVIVLFMISPATTQAQELSKKEQKALQKELKKEQQADEAAKRTLMIGFMVEHQDFVLEANRLQDAKGNSTSVSSMINFIACDSVHGVIQIGSDLYIGGNGVGGVTVEGPIANYKFTLNEKKGTYSLSYTVRSSIGIYDVRMSIYREGRAEATVTSNWPGRLNYSGYLIPSSVSKVYKGTSF
ncbi:MAG: DUF4251 domain-containing protein [Bacteroides sp.]|nr:DUF4251 domain-containing protein [Bacteroides sp.]